MICKTTSKYARKGELNRKNNIIEDVDKNNRQKWWRKTDQHWRCKTNLELTSWSAQTPSTRNGGSLNLVCADKHKEVNQSKDQFIDREVEADILEQRKVGKSMCWGLRSFLSVFCFRDVFLADLRLVCVNHMFCWCSVVFSSFHCERRCIHLKWEPTYIVVWVIVLYLKSLGEIVRVLLVGSCWLMFVFPSSSIHEFSHCFPSFPVLASAVCLFCCHFDMSNRLVASLFFTNLCLFYFVFSCCCFDKPRTSFVCSVDYVKLEIFKMVDVLALHYLHNSESWSFLPSTIFLESAFPTLWCGIKPLDHENVAQKNSGFVLQQNLWASLPLPQFRLPPSMVQPPSLKIRATTDWGGGEGRGKGFVWLHARCVDLGGNSFVRLPVQV